MAFSKNPRAEAEAKFIKGADYYPPDTPTEPVESAAVLPLKVEPEGAKPWEGLDPKGTARNDVHLRLNDHEMAKLRWVVEQNEDLSIQKVVRRILVPGLQRRIEAIK